MELKAKKFSRKLLALVMAIIMGVTCFSGTFSAFAASSKDTKYVDSAVEYNGIAWSVLSNEQVCTALLDYADSILPTVGPQLESTLATMINTNKDIKAYLAWNLADRTLTISYTGIKIGDVKVTLDSVNAIINTVNSANDLLTGGLINLLSGLFGNLKDIDLSAMKNMSREKNTSCEIVQGVFGLIQKNIVAFNNRNNNDLLGDLLQGEFGLGALNSAIFGSKGLYGKLAGLFGNVPDGYESNLVYNIVKALIFDKTEWYTAEEIQQYWSNPSSFVFDDQLLDKMTTELLDKINVQVTYSNQVLAIVTNPDDPNYGQPSLDDNGKTYYTGDNSHIRYTKLDLYMKANPSATWADACAALSAQEGVNYDPLLKYSDENRGNVLLFAYGDDMIKLVKEDTLFSFGYQALEFAWKTVLSDTVNLIHVNYNVERGHGTNFDNVYYYWARQNINWVADINDPNFANNYSQANINAWAAATYEEYNAADAEEFLGWVKNNYEFDRVGEADSTGEYDDLDATSMFNKIRYSPLADFGFNMQTGPINLYLMQTGTSNLKAFFNTALQKTVGSNGKVTYTNYTSLVDGLNNALVAACKDIFVNRDNIYYKEVGDKSVPTLGTTSKGASTATIASTLVANAAMLIQYTADTMDQNVLKKFYINHGESAVLSESNVEEAMMPLIISLIGQVNLNGFKLIDCLHPSDLRAVGNEAEGLVFLALEEYLSFVLPDKDYRGVLVNVNETSITAKKDVDGDGKATMLNDVILVMARDAVAYVMQGYVPFNGKDMLPWYPDQRDIDDPSTIFDLLNSVVCYYAGDYTWTTTASQRTSREKALGLAALFGICDTNGNSLIKESNTLWGNIDIIANHFFPLAGVLTGEGKGNFHSEPLIWNTVVEGILDIGPNSGITTFIDKLLSIISAEPISGTPITHSVYDVLEQMLNAVFGPRYANQEWKPVPVRSSDHPFDDVLQIKNFAGAPGTKDPGLLQKALCNMTEFSGYGSSGVNTYPDTLLPGLTFALTAVTNFVNFLPNISEHALVMTSADFKDDIVGGQSVANSALTVKNEASGINLAYVDRSKPLGSQVTQMSRYYIRIKSAVMSGPGTGTITGVNNQILAPGESKDFTTSTNLVGDESLYNAIVTYEIGLMENGTFVPINYNGKTTQQTNAYQYLNNKTDYVNEVYTKRATTGDTSLLWFYSSDENDGQAGSVKLNTTGTLDGLFTTQYPSYVVAKTDDLSAVDNYGVKHRKTSGLTSTKSIDGAYYWDNMSVVDGTTGGNVNVTSANPKVYVDPETGGFVLLGGYDISFDGGATWDRGNYDEATCQTKYEAASAAQKASYKKRDHVVYTPQEAKNLGIWVAAVKNANGLYETGYMKQGSNSGEAKMDSLLKAVTLMGPTKGFTVDANRSVVSITGSGKNAYGSFIKYDGMTPADQIETGKEITAHVAWYRNGKNSEGTYTFIVADTGAATSVREKIAKLQTILNNYDVDDFDPTYGAVATAETALRFALAQAGAPITATNASKIGDNLEYRVNVGTVDSQQGDPAYVPLIDDDHNATTAPAGMAPSIHLNATLNTTNWVWYYDSECKSPIYSNTRLTGLNASAYVVNDGGVLKDLAGLEIMLGSDNRYYYKNAPHMASVWDTTSFAAPFRSTIGQGQETWTDNSGKVYKYYDQIQFSYYNAAGDKVTSKSTWTIKVADASYQMKKIDSVATDNRGIFSQANDYLDYALEAVDKGLKEGLADVLFNDVSRLRNGMNSVNFDVLTYNKLVDATKMAEANYSLDITYKYAQDVYDEDGNVVKATDPETGDLFTVTEIVTKSATIGFDEYNRYGGEKGMVTAKAADGTVTEEKALTVNKVNSTLSSVQIAEYLRLFNFYNAAVYERGYKGDAIEEEIACAAGGNYDAFTVTQATDDANATVQSTSVTAPFGTYENGTLVNKGAVIYPTNLWNNYVNALADAVAIAQLGNGSYAHKTSAPYNAADKDNYDAQVSDCYTADTALQAAEIALEKCNEVAITINGNGAVKVGDDVYTSNVTIGIPDNQWTDYVMVPADGSAVEALAVDGVAQDIEAAEDGTVAYAGKCIQNMAIEVTFGDAASGDITISGRVTIANSMQGNSSGFGLGGIEIYVDAQLNNGIREGGTVVGTSNADGTYSVSVPQGTTSIIFALDNKVVAREVTIVNGVADIDAGDIAVIMGDYNNDFEITATDKSLFLSNMGGTDVYCDFNADGEVSATDKSLFLSQVGVAPDYTDIVITAN